jgi:hypothetical protein
MPWLQDPKSAITWSQPKCCDGELNPRYITLYCLSVNLQPLFKGRSVVFQKTLRMLVDFFVREHIFEVLYDHTESEGQTKL